MVFDDTMTPAIFQVILLGLLLSLKCVADPRLVYGIDSPDWLRAVGQLQVPAIKYQNGERRFYREHCTATLIARDIIVSGWHCLEYYEDLSFDIVFSLPHAEPPLQRVAHRIADGGGMDADWVLLRLSKPVRDSVARPMSVAGLAIEKGTPVFLSLAGFSRDSGIGKDGQQLSYHVGCQSLQDERHRVATNCLAYKGASGGPVVYQRTLIGVVSAGDSDQLSYYIPSRAFLPELLRYRHYW